MNDCFVFYFWVELEVHHPSMKMQCENGVRWLCFGAFVCVCVILGAGAGFAPLVIFQLLYRRLFIFE